MKKVVILFALLVSAAGIGNAQKLKAEDIVAKHLASLGPQEKVNAVRSIVAVGDLGLEFVTPKNLPAAGRVLFMSEGDKSFFAVQTNSVDYPQEKFLFDGAKTHIAAPTVTNRTILGNFVQGSSAIYSQGMFGGTLSTSWIMYKAAERGVKISVAGTKKIDGKEAYVLSVIPKGGSDVDIRMYFDQQSGRHLRTEYSRTQSAAQGRTMDESARNLETRYKVTEEFSEHKEIEGVVMPTKYRILYSRSGQNGTTELTWTALLTQIGFNQAIEAATFSAGAN